MRAGGGLGEEVSRFNSDNKSRARQESTPEKTKQGQTDKPAYLPDRLVRKEFL